MPSPETIRTQILDLVRQYHQAKFAPKAFDPDKDLVHYAGRVFWRTEQVNLVNNVPRTLDVSYSPLSPSFGVILGFQHVKIKTKIVKR